MENENSVRKRLSPDDVIKAYVVASMTRSSRFGRLPQAEDIQAEVDRYEIVGTSQKGENYIIEIRHKWVEDDTQTLKVITTKDRVVPNFEELIANKDTDNT